MKSRKPIKYVGIALGLTLASSVAFPACVGYSTCEDHGQSCGNGANGGAAAGFGGETAGGDSSGGTGNGGASGNAATGGSGTAGAGGHGGGATAGGGSAGLSGAPACDGDCKGSTPVCDEATNTCVQCLEKADCESPKPACDAATNTCVECTATTDCKDSSKPFCDTTAQQCVACLRQADCTGATASACNAGVCKACTVDAECSNIAGKGVCDAGTCVQCTAAKESACSGNSCDPATKQCTSTLVGTKDLCEACLADSECIGGNQPDPDARCAPMKFMGTARAGGFCLRRFAKTCSKPYFMMPTSLVSLSAAPAEAYCGIDQDATRCEAVLDLAASRACADGKDASCGCARDTSGACTEPGKGGICGTVLGTANTCSIPCAVAAQCKSPLTCAPVDYCH
jgi:hypothetical protein